MAAPSAARPPVPPFTDETARIKVKKAEDAWNSRDAARVALAYTEDCVWRNRGEVVRGRAAIQDFLTRKWVREQEYRLEKYLWAHGERRIAVHFQYEYHDASGQWYRCYGNENWEFDDNGLMCRRVMQGNDVPIKEADRKFRWDREERAKVAMADSEFGYDEAHELLYPAVQQ